MTSISETVARINLEDDIQPNLLNLPKRSFQEKPSKLLRRTKTEKGRPAFISGPMVRYSKLPFRELVRNYNTDIVYTPMILAREFVRNGFARVTDFSTNEKDHCLVVQVGCNNVNDMLKFVEMIKPYADGISLNCGCPITDQVREGIGAALMNKPDLVSEMIKAVKDIHGDSVSIETKIRIHHDINETVRFLHKVEDSGVDYVTIHGRTKNTRSSHPVNLEAIKSLKKVASVPVVANGDCFSLEDTYKIADYTGVDGIMAARGILINPSLFAGYSKTPWSAVELFWSFATSYGLPFRIFQHHLSEMLDKVLPRKYLKEMNEITNLVDLVDWFDENFILRRKGEDGFAQSVDVTWRYFL